MMVFMFGVIGTKVIKGIGSIFGIGKKKEVKK